ALFPVGPIWTLPLNSALTAPPAFLESTAVFALEDEQLAAYDLATGSRLWLTSIATTVEPAIGGDAVFVAQDDAILALSLRDGDVLWRQPLGATLAVPPIVASDRLVVATSDGD